MPSEPLFPMHPMSLPDLAASAKQVQELRNGERIDEWLRWGQSDDPRTRAQWAWLASKHRIDRDDWVLRLWRSILNDRDQAAKKIIEAKVPWDFYQRHFFGWFLSRFDVRAARGVFIEPQFAHLHSL